jgi:hypothetical protein
MLNTYRPAMETTNQHHLDLHLHEGGFHKWLGKKEGEPITEADIEKGLQYQGHDKDHVQKMAQFAKNSKKWHHDKKATEETYSDIVPTFENQGPENQIQNEMNPISSEDETEECFETIQSLEAYCEILQNNIKNNSIGINDAEILKIGLDYQYKRAKLSVTPLISLESFKDKTKTVHASQIALEDIKEQIKYLQEKLSYTVKK